MFGCGNLLLAGTSTWSAGQSIGKMYIDYQETGTINPWDAVSATMNLGMAVMGGYGAFKSFSSIPAMGRIKEAEISARAARNTNSKTGRGPDGEERIKIDSYKNMANDPTVTGQAHHLSQDAAFRDVIPKQEGLCIELNGNAFTDVGSQHYNAHNSLEGFWNNYRKGGNLFGEMPTIGEYNRALYNSLENAGLSDSDSVYSVLEAFKQQRSYGLSNMDLVPRIPGRINQIV